MLHRSHTAFRSPCSSYGCGRSTQKSAPPPNGVGGPETLAGRGEVAFAGRPAHLLFSTVRPTPRAPSRGLVCADVRRVPRSTQWSLLHPTLAFLFAPIAGVQPQVLEARELDLLIPSTSPWFVSPRWLRTKSGPSSTSIRLMQRAKVPLSFTSKQKRAGFRRSKFSEQPLLLPPLSRVARIR